jgi:3-oxoacyl-[acyl-carrier-protein] synthase-3
MGGDFFKDWCGGSILTAETVQDNKHNIIQDGKTVFKYAVTNMADSRINLKRNNLTEMLIGWHLANKHYRF